MAELQAAHHLLVEDGNHGEYRPRPDEFATSGVSFIRAADMDDGRVLFESAACINEVARARVRKGIGRPGDVLLSHKGTVGKVALVPHRCPDYVCSPQTTLWRVLDEAVLDRAYLFAYLQSREFKDQLASRKGETDMADYVSLTAQRQLTVPLPPLSVQRAIGTHVSMLSDRIALLRETNATLEAIAQALFKSWFVDFDPVRAKSKGLAPAGMDEATAALFPDRLEESALGPMPAGWRRGTMADVSIVGIGRTPPRKEPHWFSEDSRDVRWVSIRDMGAAGAFLSVTSEYLTAEAVQRFNVRVVPDRTVMLSFKLTVGRVAISDGDMTTNEAIAHFRLEPHAPVTPELLYLALRQFDFQTLSSTSSIADAVNSKTVRSLPVLIPSDCVVQAFQEIARPIFERLKTNAQCARSLATLRDTLLPRLVSGQIRLPATTAEDCRAALAT